MPRDRAADNILARLTAQRSLRGLGNLHRFA
jgi:hypothetical protein